ncbi:16S rRNA (adenine(1518)-N(6)/adenine(1519)-N(6))-dimethyltransferase RsmA [Flagellatimonas centrodinii]|uniref:16S rRNA (adenine(1518)-N(6)/adenine(1519)-N(6))- dimethyltransferase RsmA n=1 Tax=Flagellatimonas centrodinii TaxID=2806210 RepID=UPI001FEF2C11|nr:16S rRNA (adenine(1518)-N(6)/adenine(1519)-N(6))-dimethyltransferase RsmA [Flagellatimonas centrodinii]ULQ45370.1 16S rRNA (adenine(1518)-N(6)/adenine(1519)-N(6))-dimethyltransferase RsmA [Flagellatimonas centrodinii]
MSEMPRAKKRFGQNFLHDPGVIERLLKVINPLPTQTLVEIGPGLGALTGPLLSRCGQLDVVEIDPDVLPTLAQVCHGRGDLRVTQADALRVDYRQFRRDTRALRLVGNLPYNISSPLLFHLLGQAEAIDDMHFMLQKEVVDRICAAPGDDAYGRLTVSIAARAEAHALFTVGPGAFRPAPKVDSAIVRLRPRAPDFVIGNWVTFDRVVALAFGQRRKQLANALKPILSAAEIEACDIAAQERAERLAPADFARLAARVDQRGLTADRRQEK